jgi:hypothetical protein
MSNEKQWKEAAETAKPEPQPRLDAGVKTEPKHVEADPLTPLGAKGD